MCSSDLFLPKTFLYRMALKIYLHCIVPRLRAAKRTKLKKTSTTAKTSSCILREAMAREKRVSKREQSVAGKEAELSYYKTQTQLASQELIRLRREIETAQETKKALLSDIEDLKLNRISCIGPEHLRQISPQMLCNAIYESMKKVLSRDNRAYDNLIRVMKALNALVQIFNQFSLKQRENDRQF